MLKALWFCGCQDGAEDLEPTTPGFLGLTPPSCSSVLSQPLPGQGDFGIQCLCYRVLGLGGRS